MLFLVFFLKSEKKITVQKCGESLTDLMKLIPLKTILALILANRVYHSPPKAVKYQLKHKRTLAFILHKDRNRILQPIWRQKNKLKVNKEYIEDCLILSLSYIFNIRKTIQTASSTLQSVHKRVWFHHFVNYCFYSIFLFCISSKIFS